MLTYKRNYNIISIKEEWYQLERAGCLSSPFQSFEYMKIAWKLFYPYYITKKYYPLFYTFYDEGECVLIIPLVKYWNEKKIAIFGNENGFNYTDIIAIDTKYVTEALCLLGNRYSMLACYKILENSLLWKVLGNMFSNSMRIKNVCIHFGNDYEAYNKSLSKSVRQNLRTSYNRLNINSKQLEFKAFIGGTIRCKDYQKFLKLYTKRHEERYGVHTSKKKKWFLLHQSFATQNYMQNIDAITFAVYIDGELAAFMSGIKGCNGQYVVPRLSINDKFKFYSPGMILLNESIKYFISNTNIRYLDLSQGEEQYKYKMGGETHFTHNFEIDFNSFNK